MEPEPDAKPAFTVIPAVHLEDGRLVDWEEGDPLEALTQLSRAHGEVFLIDARGVRRNKADLGFIERASHGRVLWLDAGPRFVTDAMDVLVAGAARIVVRSATLASLAELDEAAEMTETGSVYLALEYQDGEFVANPLDKARRPESLVERAGAAGLGLLVVAERHDHSLGERFMDFPGERWFRATREASAADVADLEKLGFKGLIVPAALVEKVKPA